MASKSIEELKKNRARSFSKKNSQIPYAVLFLTLTFFVYLTIQNDRIYGHFWIIGILLGLTLQRSRICFAASFRDPVLVGSTTLLKAILIALMVSTIGFVVVDYKCVGECIKTLGQVYPVGLHTIIGAVMFGIGMVIAGGCASGFLMRIGEGFILQIVVLFGFALGALLGTRHFSFWDKVLISKAPTVFFPDYLGYPLATIGQISVLLCLYFLADWYDKKNNIMSM